MQVERFFVPGLAHASYLVASAGEAAVIDPERHVDQYLRAAEARGVRITAILETHPHADFVSGHVELAERTGAPIYLSGKAGAEYDHRDLTDGDLLTLGDARITALYAPGHSPDSVVFLFEEGDERILFTGDVLFAGDVGRPDLRDATDDPRSMATALYETLHRRIFTLPDATVVYPTHGAGSLCGRNIGSQETTTIGEERAHNWAMKISEQRAFVEAMISNLPPRPVYFSHAVMQNLKGAPHVRTDPLQEITAAEVRSCTSAVIVDVRSQSDFGLAHLKGSLNIGAQSPLFSTWAGFLIEPGASIVLVATSASDAERARYELTRIGYDEVQGYVLARRDEWERAGLEIATIEQIPAEREGEWTRSPRSLVDVRSEGEWRAGHVEGAIWLPLARIVEDASTIPDGPIAFMCGSGYRSSIATSFARRYGRADVVNVAGGWSAWIAAQR
jgi:hydroxyacylglutathione hydrolase